MENFTYIKIFLVDTTINEFIISGLPSDVTDQEAALLFQDYKLKGKTTIEVVKDDTDGICVGYALITFANSEIGKEDQFNWIITQNDRKQSYGKVQ